MSTIKAMSPLSSSCPRRTTRDLTPVQHWLVQVMAEYQFGRIENLGVIDGQPAPDHRLNIIRAARFGKEDIRKVPVADDPELRRTVWELFDEIEKIRDGCIVRLEFRYGLRFLLETGATAAVGGLSSVPSPRPGEKS